MSKPEIRVMALSNVFSRLMYFKRKGDIEHGHRHNYNHATLLSSGSVNVEILDPEGSIKSSKVFQAPIMIYIDKDKIHRLTALEDNTVCVCIHAMRTVDEEIIDPEFLIEPIISEVNREGDVGKILHEKAMKEYKKPIMSQLK